MFLFSGLVFILSVTTACSPIDDYEESLKIVEKKIEKKEYAKSVSSAENIIKSLSKDAAYTSLLRDEVLNVEIEKANVIVKEIHNEAKALRALGELDNNDTNVQKAGQIHKKMKHAITKLNVALREWKDDYKRVVDIVSRRDVEKASLEKAYDAFTSSYTDNKAKFNKATIDHPHQGKRIASFEANLAKFDNDFRHLLSFFVKSLTLLTIEDYLDYVENYNKLQVSKNFPLTLSSDYSRMIDQLYKSYSKVLLAKEESHGVMLNAVSWDNYYDYPTEHNRTFPYTEVTYDQLRKIQSYIGQGISMSVSRAETDDTIAFATSNRSRSGWQRFDDEAEIWIEDAESEYVHSYLVIEDGQTSEIEENVERAFYTALAGAIGKEVFSKPYGKFEDEAIDKPQTPGMAYVGNSQYGQWQTDPISGAEIWTWFMAYSIIDDIVDDRIDRRRHERYMSSMRNYTPPRERKDHSWTNSYGVTSNKSPIQQSLTRSRSSNLRGSGESFRNRGPGKGKGN